MRVPDVHYINIGPRLTLTFALLIALILGGNGLLVWQFQIARAETERLTGISEQLVAVLRLQESLLLFHQRLDELAQAQDAARMVTEAEPLRRLLLEQAQRTRTALTHMPSQMLVDPAFLPTLQAIEITLPSQLDAIIALANSGDWGAVRFRVSNELKPLETQTSALVNSIDQEVSQELTRAVGNMEDVERRIVLVVPITAIATFLIAAFFGWAMTRRIVELRMEERVDERTRIARELHDTLLQSFQGLMFLLQAVRDLLPDRPAEAMEVLGRAMVRGEQAIAEGRNAVQDLRSSADIEVDLVQRLTLLSDELSRHSGAESSATFNVYVEGRRRGLNQAIMNEVYSVAREALTNAYRHAKAKAIEAEVTYGDSLFRLRIRDDGAGFDPSVKGRVGRSRHFGLTGMQERAKKVGGELSIWSQVGAGTEVDLAIPISAAYKLSIPTVNVDLFQKKD